MGNGLSIGGGLPPAELSKLKRHVQSGGTVNINFAELLKQYNSYNMGTTTGSGGFGILSTILNIVNQTLQGVLFSIVNSNSQANQSSQVADSNTVNTEAINKTKQALSADLASYQAKGIKVSDWDANNSCTLSVNGKTATITIDNSGNTQFSGDMEAIADYLKSDPQEAEALKRQQEFIEQLKIQGDPVVGNVKSTTVPFGGKDVAVNEYTTQRGKKYYLDINGNQVTPDVTTNIT